MCIRDSADTAAQAWDLPFRRSWSNAWVAESESRAGRERVPPSGLHSDCRSQPLLRQPTRRAMSARSHFVTLLLLAALRMPAQEASAGFSMPVTLTGGALYTHRLQTGAPTASPVAAGFHGVLYPSLKLGPHWFVYSSIHLRSTPFSYYDAYESEHEFKAQVVQAFLGYTRTLKK